MQEQIEIALAKAEMPLEALVALIDKVLVTQEHSLVFSIVEFRCFGAANSPIFE